MILLYLPLLEQKVQQYPYLLTIMKFYVSGSESTSTEQDSRVFIIIKVAQRSPILGMLFRFFINPLYSWLIGSLIFISKSSKRLITNGLITDILISCSVKKRANGYWQISRACGFHYHLDSFDMFQKRPKNPSGHW